MIAPVTIDKISPYLGQECALCKQLLSPGEEVVICPQDGTRHHVRCWQQNGNHCTAYGCTGEGVVGAIETRRVPPRATPLRLRRYRRRAINRFGQNCLVLSIALAILFFAVGCFGLWAIADYIMLEVLGWNYRVPLSAVPLHPALLVNLLLLL